MLTIKYVQNISGLPEPLFQSEAKYDAIDIKIVLMLMQIKFFFCI